MGSEAICIALTREITIAIIVRHVCLGHLQALATGSEVGSVDARGRYIEFRTLGNEIGIRIRPDLEHERDHLNVEISPNGLPVTVLRLCLTEFH